MSCCPGAHRGASPTARSPTRERRVQRVRKALDPPGEARDDIDILLDAGGPARPRLALRRPRADLGRAAPPLPHARRHEVGRGSTSSAASSGRASPRTRSNRRSCTGACGPTIPPIAAVLHRSAWCTTIRRSRRSPTTSRCGSPPVDGSTRTTPASNRAGTAARTAWARRSTLARGRRASRHRRRRDGARSPRPRSAPRRPGTHRSRPATRAGVHDVPLPRRGRRQPAHDRRHRSEGRARPSSRPPRCGSTSSCPGRSVGVIGIHDAQKPERDRRRSPGPGTGSPAPNASTCGASVRAAATNPLDLARRDALSPTAVDRPHMPPTEQLAGAAVEVVAPGRLRPGSAHAGVGRRADRRAGRGGLHRARRRHRRSRA